MKIRPFTPDDLLAFAAVNLDRYTETVSEREGETIPHSSKPRSPILSLSSLSLSSPFSPLFPSPLSIILYSTTWAST